MNIIKFFGRFIYHQIKNIAKFTTKKRLTISSLGSMTLDIDDVEIAKEWLKFRESWYEPDIVSEYENLFASWNSSKFAFAFMSGRVTLSAIISALGLKPGDEVIVPGYTCVVVPNAFDFAGVKVIYSDIELDTYGLDATHIKQKFSNRTKGILIHHLYGIVCRDYIELIQIARDNGLFVIEDCAQSTGAKYKGINVGNYGDVAFYSSEISKIYTTIQGGIATTNDEKIAGGIQEFYSKASYPDEEWIERQLHNVILNYYCYKHPQRWLLWDLAQYRYGHYRLISTTDEEERGIKPLYYGRKAAAPIASLGLNQLKKIENYNRLRRITSEFWKNWCIDEGYKQPLIIDDSEPVFLRYPVLVEPEKKRNRSWGVNSLGVEVGNWFSSNLHPVKDRRVDGCPNADIAVEQCINLPGLIL